MGQAWPTVRPGSAHCRRSSASSASGKTESADGDIRWSGGPMRYRLGGKDAPPRCRRCWCVYNPPLSEVPKRIGAWAVAQGGQLPLVGGGAAGSWLKVQVAKRSLRLADAPWLGKGAGGEAVATLEERLL